jgi:phosphotransferase system enzyme I (PtsP)
MKRPPARPKDEKQPDDVGRLKSAWDIADKALRALVGQANRTGLGASSQFLSTYVEIVSDARLRGETVKLCESGVGVAEALGRIARVVARSAAAQKSPFLEERARDIEDLCDALVMIAISDPRVTLPSKAILVADQLTVFDILVSSRSRPVGIALSERAIGPRTGVLLSLLGIPSMIDVGGLFRWVSDGDVALLDADHGFFVLNPSRSEVASVREARRLNRDAAAVS